MGMMVESSEHLGGFAHRVSREAGNCQRQICCRRKMAKASRIAGTRGETSRGNSPTRDNQTYRASLLSGAVARAFGMELSSITSCMRALLHTEFDALLARAGVSQGVHAQPLGIFDCNKPPA
jgi:hypothetical protein